MSQALSLGGAKAPPFQEAQETGLAWRDMLAKSLKINVK
jgi:hypothetical protein